MSTSKVTKSFEMLVLGRLVFGVFCGLAMSLNPLYILEVAPPSRRGALAALNQVACATGILLGMVSRRLSSQWPSIPLSGLERCLGWDEALQKDPGGRPPRRSHHARPCVCCR